jgi:hypothetical protein
VSFVIEVEQSHVVEFFVEEGMKRVEMFGRVNKYYGSDAPANANVLLNQGSEIGGEKSFKRSATKQGAR